MTQRTARPLSPHLQVYKPQITSVSSILNRITGLLLSAFAVGWVIALICLNQGIGSWESFIGFAGSFPGCLLSMVATWSLFYHMLNGMRHLVWDTGHWLELETSKRTGWLVVIGSFVASALAWGYWS